MSDFTNAAKKVVNMVKNTKDNGPKAYDSRAVVKHVDKKSRKAFVKIGDEVDETPVDLTIDCNPGDTVQVRVGGGKAWLTGNTTAPPTDSRPAISYTNKHVAETKEEVNEYTDDQTKKVLEKAKKYTDENTTYNQYMDFVPGENGGLKFYAESKEGQTLTTYSMMRSTGLYVYENDSLVAHFGTEAKLYSPSSGNYPIFQVKYSSDASFQRAWWNDKVDSDNSTATKNVILEDGLDSIDDVLVHCRTWSGNNYYDEYLSLPGQTAQGSPTLEGVAYLDYTTTTISYNDAIVITATHNSSYADKYVEMLDIKIIYSSETIHPKILCGYRPDYEGGIFGISDGYDGNVFDVDYLGNIKSNGVADVHGIRVYGMLPFKTFTATGSGQLTSSGGAITCTGTVPPGYIPIAVQSIQTNHNYTALIGKFVISSNGVNVSFGNRGSSALDVTVTAEILCTALHQQ